MHTDELVTVYTLTDPIKAELLRNLLEEEGIRCLLDGINQASAVGLPGTTIHIQVSTADAEQARELLVSHDAAPPDTSEEDVELPAGEEEVEQPS